MTIATAAELLCAACNRVPGRKKEAIVLFGIKFADELKSIARSSSLSRVLQKVVKESGIGDSFHTELRLGVNLQEYVILRSSLLFFD